MNAKIYNISEFQQRVSKSFGSSAKAYDKSSALQKTIVDNLISLAKAQLQIRGEVLDIGSGTGYIQKKLGQDLINLDISQQMLDEIKGGQKICSSMESIPLEDKSIDIIFSSSAIHWSSNLEQVFSEINRLIKGSGFLILATFIDGSLEELNRSYKITGIKNRPVNKFPEKNEILELSFSHDFKLIEQVDEEFTIEQESAIDLLKNIKDIGGSVVLKDKRNILNRGLFNKIESSFRPENCTWKVSYFIFKK